MAYIKYGIVTKIEVIKNINRSNEFIKKNFNLDLYNKKDKIFYLKNEIISPNIKNFRNEVMEYTNHEGDSLNNCEAYCLEVEINKLINSEIKMLSNNEKYYFSCNKNQVFETDNITIGNNIKIKLYIIPIFWDINSIKAENFIQVSCFVNNLTRKTFVNVLKDASFLVVI